MITAAVAITMQRCVCVIVELSKEQGARRKEIPTQRCAVCCVSRGEDKGVCDKNVKVCCVRRARGKGGMGGGATTVPAKSRKRKHTTKHEQMITMMKEKQMINTNGEEKN